MECVFCNIVGGRLPAEVLYETGDVLAILDIRPIHYGHALVIPKAHYPDFLSVPQRELGDVLGVTQIVARGLVRSLGLEGYNIFSNNGTIAGQSVFHFHMHITPRYPDDDIKFVLRLKSYDDGAMAEYARRIRSGITA